MQGQYQPQPPSLPPAQLPLPSGYLPPSRSPHLSKSVENMRGQYDPRGGPAPPVPTVHPYRPVGAPVQPQMYPTYQQPSSSTGQYLRQPGNPASPAPVPHYPSQQQQPQPASAAYASFDPRVMRPTSSQGRQSTPAPLLHMPAPPPPLPQRRSKSPGLFMAPPPPASSDQYRSPIPSIQQQFQARRPSSHDLAPPRMDPRSLYDHYHAPPPPPPPLPPNQRLPNLAGHISLRPGETLQQVVRRSAADIVSDPAGSSARPPIAAHMRVSDPSLETARDSLSRAQVGRYAEAGILPRRSSGDQRAEREREREREWRESQSKVRRELVAPAVPESRPLSRTEREEAPTSARSSGSSFTSLKSSPHVRRRSHEEEGLSHRSSYTSTRSSTTSIPGPLTPANDRAAVALLPLGNKLTPAMIPYADFADDDEDEEAGTWLKQPTPFSTPGATTPASRPSTANEQEPSSGTMKKQHSAPGHMASSLPRLDTGELLGSNGTLQPGGDWSTFLINPFSALDLAEHEGTMTPGHDALEGAVVSPEDIGTSSTLIPSRGGQLQALTRLSLPPSTVPTAAPMPDESRFYRSQASLDREDHAEALAAEAEEEIEGGTWLVAPSASPEAPNQQDATLHEELFASRKDQRPNLRLTINAPPSPTVERPVTTTSPTLRTDHVAQTSSSKDSARPVTPQLADLGPAFLTSPPIIRRASFAHREAESDWAFRPPIETVLENLDEFFPEHDLDKPILDAPSPPTTNLVSPNISPATPERALPRHKSGVSHASAAAASKHKKSIRKVALDRKRVNQSAVAAVAAATAVRTASDEEAAEAELKAGLLRRKSTKLWGTRVEEVTPAQAKSMSTAIAESPADDEVPENCELLASQVPRAFTDYPFRRLSFVQMGQGRTHWTWNLWPGLSRTQCDQWRYACCQAGRASQDAE